ncbi:hypothetical protein GXM_06495 [Nostoc sphaeroides CCNUC1]|uniref:Uncharacterized protein n=1 Tax=Nostoc sphaeroides CCNUC1 TaxID=2653204 RepID=A0A5P8W8X1_9NOSO|nr:hypothetical protein GXM_06495 [Nostoc sphaeroides CCNUC1]
MKKSLSGYTSKIKLAVINRVYTGKTRLKNLNFPYLFV